MDQRILHGTDELAFTLCPIARRQRQESLRKFTDAIEALCFERNQRGMSDVRFILEVRLIADLIARQ